LYKKVLSKEELKEASKEIIELKKKSKRNGKILITLTLAMVGIIFAILAILEAFEIMTISGIVEIIVVLFGLVGALQSIFSSFMTPILLREYAFGSNAFYFGKSKISWIKLEQRNIAIKLAKQGLLLEPEKWWHRIIFIFTKEVKAVEGIIKTHLKVRY
jgi:uncharacterized membrane protein YjjP (DUF1212 family)